MTYLLIILFIIIGNAFSLDINNFSPQISSINNNKFVYLGRMNNEKDTIPTLSWPCEEIHFMVENTDEIKLYLENILIKDMNLDRDIPSVISVYINQVDKEIQRVKVRKNKSIYTIKLPSKAKYSIRIVKITETIQGFVKFYGLDLVNNDSKLLDMTLEDIDHENIKIEFYGDSITAGYATEDVEGNNFAQSNCLLSYASLTAEKLKAQEYRLIAISGIGFYRQIPFRSKSKQSLYIQNVYDTIDSENVNVKYNFNWRPDVIVINIGQNDYHRANSTQMITKWKEFIKLIRNKYGANNLIIMALGSMSAVSADSTFPNALKETVQSLNQQGDKYISTLIFPFERMTHPSQKHNQLMAEKLTNLIIELRAKYMLSNDYTSSTSWTSLLLAILFIGFVAFTLYYYYVTNAPNQSRAEFTALIQHDDMLDDDDYM